MLALWKVAVSYVHPSATTLKLLTGERNINTSVLTFMQILLKYMPPTVHLYQAEPIWQWQQHFPAERWPLPQPKNEQELKLGPRTPSIDLASSFRDPNPTNYPQERQNKPNTKRPQPITHRIQMISCQHPSAWHSRHPQRSCGPVLAVWWGLTQY